jgi:TetR/AcrR family transcriptional repressor of mexJK operon
MTMITDTTKTKSCTTTGRPKDALKRENIIAAATTLFMKQGYELTSVEAIAKTADVSKLTIYSHFTNKTELFRIVIEQCCDQLAAPESFIAYAKLPVKQGLMQLGGSLTALIYSDEAIHLQRIMQSEALQHGQIVKVFYEAGPQRVKLAFAELLSVWQQQKQLVITDINRATEQFFSLLKGEVYVKAMLLLSPIPTADEIELHVQSTVTMFLAAYQAKPIMDQL